MLRIRPRHQTLSQLLAIEESIEDRIAYTKFYRALIQLQENIDVAAYVLSGIKLPPHQRLLIRGAHLGVPENVFIGSRGTSKTATLLVVFQFMKLLLFPKRKAVTLSATGFRGGQVIYDDAEKWLLGGWDSQEPNLQFLTASVITDKLIKRAQNYWVSEMASFSQTMTVPTNDPEKIRGLRAHDLFIDEANFADQELVEKVAESFLNVLADFATGGQNAPDNCLYYTTTIDYGWRDFQRTVKAARQNLEREYAASKARGEPRQALEKQGVLKSLLLCFDYSDTIIRKSFTTRDGRQVTVHWPDPNFRWFKDPTGVPFTVRNEQGVLQREGVPGELLTTYPINRNVENKLLSGNADEAIWLAEQRNVVDSAAGDVYPTTVVDLAVCRGDRFVIPWDECGPEWKKHYPNDAIHYAPRIMMRCTDPCVLGVDYARSNRDFSAFVVMRLGPLAKDSFNPLTGLGKTTWSNVVWAEQHRNMSAKDAATKIFELAERYNLVWFHDGEQDSWKAARAVGLDLRHAGSAVRDELVRLHQESLRSDEYRMYDPLDPDQRIRAFSQGPIEQSRPMLDAIQATDQMNDRLVDYTLQRMKNAELYLPKEVPVSEREPDKRYDAAYSAVRVLEHQLRKLQAEPTKNYRHFFMQGDAENVANKKDLWAAFIYGAKQARAHLLRAQMINDTPPPMGMRVIRNSRARVRPFGGMR